MLQNLRKYVKSRFVCVLLIGFDDHYVNISDLNFLLESLCMVDMSFRNWKCTIE